MIFQGKVVTIAHLSYYIFYKWPLFKTLFLNCFQLHFEKKFILYL